MRPAYHVDFAGRPIMYPEYDNELAVPQLAARSYTC